MDRQWKKEQVSLCCTADVCLRQSVNKQQPNKRPNLFFFPLLDHVPDLPDDAWSPSPLSSAEAPDLLPGQDSLLSAPPKRGLTYSPPSDPLGSMTEEIKKKHFSFILKRGEMSTNDQQD